MDKFMQEALREAYIGIENGHGGPFGCVIVKDNIIVGRGHNEVIKNNDCTCHGEIMAIRDACKRLNTYDLSGCDLYTTSQACPMCQGAIQWANIRSVKQACNIVDAENIGFRDKQFFETPVVGVELEREQGLKLFDCYSKMTHEVY